MSPDDEICYCFHVSQRKLVNFVRITRPRVASQMSDCFGAGTGCGWCRPILVRLFENARRDPQPLRVESTGTPADTMTATEYAAARAAYIRAGKGKPPPGATPLPPSGPARASEN